MFKKKNKKNKKNKRRDLLLANFIIILFFGVLIAMVAHVLGIAVLLVKTGGEEEYLVTADMVMKTNTFMNVLIALVIGAYSILHIVNYGLYLFRKEIMLKLFMVLDVMIYISCLVFGLEPLLYSIFLVPVLSGFIYLKLLKIEE